MELVEPILTPNPNRFTLFPIQHQDIWDLHKKAESAYWTAEEVDLTQDVSDWDNKLNDNERYYLKNILAFFNNSDCIVNENLAINFYQQVQYPEARCFYGFQLNIENTHSLVYSLLIDTFIKDKAEQLKYFHAIDEVPCVKEKAGWALKYIHQGSFVQKLVAFAVVEGIFFSGSFCAIYWLKSRNLMPGLSFANILISQDEQSHASFAAHLYKNHIVNKLPEDELRGIIHEALQLEKKFIEESLPVSLIGMNADLMKQYLNFVADNLLVLFGLPKVYGDKNPFTWMEQIALENKTNFFEKRVPDYNKAKTGVDASQNVLSFDEEF